MIPIDQLVNDFALRSFRDTADGDYIAARMACRAGLPSQFLWAAQQAVEKYLKCILLLHRIPARHVRHDLSAALRAVASSRKLELELTDRTLRFIERLDRYGRFRYLEISHWAERREIISLDQAVWELRRYCTLSRGPRALTLSEGSAPPRVALSGGYLESVIENPKARARPALIWQNPFFGSRRRRTVRVGGWARGVNAPLALHPELFAEIDKYVLLPKDVRGHFLERNKSGALSV